MIINFKNNLKNSNKAGIISKKKFKVERSKFKRSANKYNQIAQILKIKRYLYFVLLQIPAKEVIHFFYY